MDSMVDAKGAGSGRATAIVFGAAGLLVAAVAWYAYLEVAHRNAALKVGLAIEEIRKVKRLGRAYYQAHGALPPTNAALQLDDRGAKPYSNVLAQPDVLAYSIDVREGKITLVFGPDQGSLSGQSIVYSPAFPEGKLRWFCTGTIPQEYLPARCHP